MERGETAKHDEEWRRGGRERKNLRRCGDNGGRVTERRMREMEQVRRQVGKKEGQKDRRGNACYV